MIGNLLFNIAPAIKIIFQLGYEPKENYFYELTDEQYEQLKNDDFDISSTMHTSATLWCSLLFDQKLALCAQTQR